ncbi:MAG: hypothetical protein AB1758_03720, partial [Candidatus Eremiobacterota bacterium]
PPGATPVELYRLFCARRDGSEPSPELLEAFERLREEGEREAAPKPKLAVVAEAPAKRGRPKK